MLAVKHIRISYEGKPLLKDVSFEVYPDETVCLLGSSGSGKSTLLRIIAGLEDAEGGEILWKGKSVSDIPVHRRRFGVMFQDYALFPHRTVAQNIAFGLRMQDLPKSAIQEQVIQSLNTIDMIDFANRKVTDLSGGEQQRVALARALAPQPRLLMLDEPLGALDRTLREQLSHELRRILHESKMPAIYVTHDQEEAYAIADRLLLLHDGIILQSGKPHEFYHHPRNAWVAKFFGLGNLVKGTITSTSPLTANTPIGEIKANCDHANLEEGQAIALLFRPTQARLKFGEDSNKISGKVTDQVFQGEQYQVTLAINEHLPEFNVMTAEPVEIGSALTVGYPPEDVLCLPDESA